MRWRRQIQHFAALAQRHYIALIALGRLGMPSDIVDLIEMEILRNTMPFTRTIHGLLRCIACDRKPAERSWQDLCAQRNAMIRMFGTLVHHKRFFYRLLLNMPLMVTPLDAKRQELQTVTTPQQRRRFRHIADACEGMFSQLVMRKQHDDKYQ